MHVKLADVIVCVLNENEGCLRKERLFEEVQNRLNFIQEVTNHNRSIEFILCNQGTFVLDSFSPTKINSVIETEIAENEMIGVASIQYDFENVYNKEKVKTEYQLVHFLSESELNKESVEEACGSLLSVNVPEGCSLSLSDELISQIANLRAMIAQNLKSNNPVKV